MVLSVLLISFKEWNILAFILSIFVCFLNDATQRLHFILILKTQLHFKIGHDKIGDWNKCRLLVNFSGSCRKNGKCCENLINITNVDQSVLIFVSKFQRDTTRTDNFIRLKSNKRFTICSQKQQPLVRSNDAIFDREHVLRKLS